MDGLPPRERAWAMVAVCAAIAMATLDTAITNTALPTIAADIGTDGASAVWVVNAYQIVVVAALLPLAALGDIVGHRRVYTAGLILFTLTSLACGLAWSLPSLVAARAAQGLGAAMVMSVNAALVRFIYPARTLGRGVGVNALVVAISFTFGPTVASGILSVTTWHWLFLINVPVGLAAVFIGLRTLPATKRAGHRFDPVAALLCAGVFSLLITGLGTIAHGSSWLVTGAQWGIALACFWLLLRRQAGHPAPMLAVDLLRRPVFALSCVTAICSFGTQGLAFVSLPFFLQHVMGYDQVATGFLMTPWPAVVGVMALIAGRLSDRYPPGMLGGLGLALLCAGMASLALMPADTGTTGITWRMMLCGAGFGFFQSPNMKALLDSAPPQRSGGASGIAATVRLLGQSIGAALVALCLTVSHDRGPELALWLGAGFSAAGCIASFLRLAAPSGRRMR
jgi:DHA2 family multidrug resistance protein-like MFS transporter